MLWEQPVHHLTVVGSFVEFEPLSAIQRVTNYWELWCATKGHKQLQNQTIFIYLLFHLRKLNAIQALELKKNTKLMLLFYNFFLLYWFFKYLGFLHSYQKLEIEALCIFRPCRECSLAVIWLPGSVNAGMGWDFLPKDHLTTIFKQTHGTRTVNNLYTQ